MEEVEATWWQKLLKLEPAVVTGFIVSFFALIGAVLGITFAEETVQNVITVVLGLTALLSTVLLRGKVTANSKVVVRDDTPLSNVSTIRSGPATVTTDDMHDVEAAARMAEGSRRRAA